MSEINYGVQDGKTLPFKLRVLLAQNELKAPKSQINKFANYKYRKAEDILEAAKPINLKYGLLLTIVDEIIFTEGRFYLRANARLDDVYTNEFIATTAYAREEEEKKGMDASQLTGATSSYARKYALNGLYNIDDTQDADTNEQQSEREHRQQRSTPVNRPQAPQKQAETPRGGNTYQPSLTPANEPKNNDYDNLSSESNEISDYFKDYKG